MKKYNTNNYPISASLATTWVLFSFSANALASGMEIGEFRFVFNGVAALATFGGIVCIWLGYRLFTKGINQNRGELKAKVKFVEILFSGIGP